jgi:hypothetical protein
VTRSLGCRRRQGGGTDGPVDEATGRAGAADSDLDLVEPGAGAAMAGTYFDFGLRRSTRGGWTEAAMPGWGSPGDFATSVMLSKIGISLGGVRKL